VVARGGREEGKREGEAERLRLRFGFGLGGEMYRTGR